MEFYDLFMLGILAFTAMYGYWKGLAWQVAAVASLTVSYFVSLRFSEPLAGTGWFGDSAPANRFLAMLALYVITGAAIWLGFRVVRETIQQIKLRDFDRQLGALVGAAKGVFICVAVTFFVVTLLPEYRPYVLGTRSGRAIGSLLAQAESVLPPELQQMLAPYLGPLDEALRQRVATSSQPNSVPSTPSNQPLNSLSTPPQPPTIDTRWPQFDPYGWPNSLWNGGTSSSQPNNPATQPATPGQPTQPIWPNPAGGAGRSNGAGGGGGGSPLQPLPSNGSWPPQTPTGSFPSLLPAGETRPPFSSDPRLAPLPDPRVVPTSANESPGFSSRLP
ncbi:MAG: CvpA family protein [Pirellulales bacterium]|nr:CvpA family protein [Pirellulales bacterium]